MQTVGIDLGTTYSCIARFKNGAVEIIPNDQGQRVTPSVVCFTEGERMIGEGAVNQAHRDPEQVVFDNKRMIGRSYDDPDLQKETKQWPFKVAKAASSNKPVIKVMVDGQEKDYFPEEISALVLGKMKDIAETYTGDKVGGAVVTVPAYFNDSQRQSTKDAGTIAGLNVLRIINEPTAAAIAYGLDKKGEKEQHALIFDLGGGTFDVSFIAIEDGVFEVKATKGDTHLGGRDFDNMLVTRMIQEFKKTSGKDISDNKRAVCRLRTAIERSKRVLSSAMQVTIEVDGLYQSMDFYHTLTRARFNEMCEPFFEKCIEIVKDCMADAKVDKQSVDQVVCVGGSTRIPRVIEKLTQFFGKEPFRSINPDEAIAYGAAVQAAILGGDKDEAIKDVLLLDVTALSLGVETAGGIMAVVVPRNTTVPTKQSQVFTTSADGQTSVEIKVYEGERVRTEDCNCLGTFTVTQIPPAPRGTPQIEVCFNVSNDGILNVEAEEKKSGAKNRIEISKRASNLSQDYIQKAVADAEKNSEKDKKIKEAAEKRNELEGYVYSVKTSITQHKAKFSEAEIKKMEDALNEADRVIDLHKDMTDSSPFVEAHKNCKAIVEPFMMKIYQDASGAAAGADPGAAGAAGAAGGDYPFGGSSPYGGAAGPDCGAAGPDCGASGPTVEEVD